MNKVKIIRYIAHEGPGYVTVFLDNHDIPHELIRIDANDPVPASIDGVAGLVLMGGPMSVNDDLPWIEPILHLIRQALDTDVPVLGHCLGGQLIAKALGAAITRNPVPEHGWLPVNAATNPTAQQWLHGLPSRFDAFHWHGETFTLPEGATQILSSDYCANQGFVIGNTLALQCHVEMTSELVRDWVARTDDAELTPGPAIQSKKEMLADLEARVRKLQAAAKIIYSRWIEGLV